MDAEDTHQAHPKLLTVEPEGEHKQTFIFLHGRGDTAPSFKDGLLHTSLLDGSVLTEKFPYVKWIFPQASLSELAAAPGWKYHQWFDVWHLRPGAEETDLQIPGLRDTVELIHNILRQEIASVGAQNVVLGGLSQGCASSMIASLLWEGEAFAACVGMCGWMPFRKVLDDAAQIPIPETNPEGTEPPSPGQNAVSALRNKLKLDDSTQASLPFKKIPFFLGHGTDDATVWTSLGKEAATCLEKIGADVEYKEYEDLDHWYSDAMLQDVSQFIELNLD